MVINVNSFSIRLFSLMIIVVTFLGYNSVLKNREQAEKIDRLEHQLNKTEINGIIESNQNNYKNGKYKGKADGFGGTIEVEVVVEKGNISKINIVSADGEDKSYLDMAEKICDDIISAQTSDVDTISGATFSSTGIKNAVKQAIGKAEV